MISVLVPYAPAGPERERAWAWLAERWRVTMPDAEVIVAEPRQMVDPGNPALFCRAAALNRAAEQATGQVFVLADADTAFAPFYVRTACWAVADSQTAWVLPGRYVRLSQPFTDRWLEAGPWSPVPPGWEQQIEEEWPANVSGIVIVPRAAYEIVQGFDERFAGWGWEDGSFAHALDTLWGTVERVPEFVAWHLWHPRPPEHSTHGPFAEKQQRLGARYIAASGNIPAMAALLNERE